MALYFNNIMAITSDIYLLLVKWNGWIFFFLMMECLIVHWWLSLMFIFRPGIKTQFYLTFFIGSAVNLLLITPEKALKLVVNDYLRYKFTNKK